MHFLQCPLFLHAKAVHSRRLLYTGDRHRKQLFYIARVNICFFDHQTEMWKDRCTAGVASKTGCRSDRKYLIKLLEWKILLHSWICSRNIYLSLISGTKAPETFAFLALISTGWSYIRPSSVTLGLKSKSFQNLQSWSPIRRLKITFHFPCKTFN